MSNNHGECITSSLEVDILSTLQLMQSWGKWVWGVVTKAKCSSPWLLSKSHALTGCSQNESRAHERTVHIMRQFDASRDSWWSIIVRQVYNVCIIVRSFIFLTSKLECTNLSIHQVMLRYRVTEVTGVRHNPNPNRLRIERPHLRMLVSIMEASFAGGSNLVQLF